MVNKVKNSEQYKKLAIEFIQNKYIPFLNRLNVTIWLQIVDADNEVYVYSDESSVELFGTGEYATKLADDVYYSDFTNQINRLAETSGSFAEIKSYWANYEKFLHSADIESFHLIYPLLNPLINETKWIDVNGTALVRDEQGFPVVVAGTYSDVTQEFSIKKKNEEYLKHLQELTAIFRAGEAIGKFGFIEYNFEEYPDLVRCTEAALKIFGWEEREDAVYPLNRLAEAIFEKCQYKKRVTTQFEDFVEGRSEFKGVIIPLVNGLWIEANATALEYYLDGRVKRAVCSVLDITDNYLKNEKIEALNDIFNEAEKAGQFGSYEFNRGKYANKFCITKNGARILGLKVKQDNLYTLKELSATLTATETKDYIREVTDYIHKITAGVINSFNLKCAVRVSEEIRWVKFSAYAKSYGADGQIATAIGAIVDITENMRLLKKTESLAFTDTMTGLLNKNALSRDFSEKGNSRYTHYFFADINGFKAINDHFGHMFGDCCLEALADRLRDYNVLNSDKVFRVYRIYGDEFVLACTVSSDFGIEDRVNHLLQFLDKPYEICSQQININLSIGIIENGHNNLSLEDMLGSVDQAMYIAKKNKFKYYILGRDEKNFGFVINQYFSGSVSENDVIPYYQPIVDIIDNSVIGYEFFSRLRIGEQLVDPVDFFSHAKEKLRLPEIDRIIFYSVLAYFDELGDDSLADKKLFFNIDAQTVWSDNIVDFLRITINRYGFCPKNIVFEINEKSASFALLHSEIIQEIKSLGVHIIIDDFSASDYSLSALKNLEFSYIKLSKGLLKDIGKNKLLEQLYSTLSELVHSYDIAIIAQGVEASEHLKLLRKCEIRFCQGYYFAHPVELSNLSLSDITEVYFPTS